MLPDKSKSNPIWSTNEWASQFPFTLLTHCYCYIAPMGDYWQSCLLWWIVIRTPARASQYRLGVDSCGAHWSTEGPHRLWHKWENPQCCSCIVPRSEHVEAIRCGLCQCVSGKTSAISKTPYRWPKAQWFVCWKHRSSFQMIMMPVINGS